MSKAHYVMVGGFLGAGKTTAILKMAQRLRQQGLRIGLITNDQSMGLVDTAMLNSHGFPVEEITGGCFCCKFKSLVEASERLSAQNRPDIFIAEPVGSCTDLKATVDYPLRRIYGENFRIAPLSVLIDPIRALRILGLEAGKVFSPKVVYIYTKQLEEADLLVINKVDLLDPSRLDALMQALRQRFPRAEVLPLSARHETGLEAWIERLGATDAPATSTAMEMDYNTYADGEAMLGWLNATIRLSSSSGFDGNAALMDLLLQIESRLQAAGVEVAHLKATLSPREYGNDIAVANWVRNDASPELSHRLQEPLECGQLIVNLRAEADAQTLRPVFLESIGAFRGGLEVSIEHVECFRPARPNPTHRLASL